MRRTRRNRPRAHPARRDRRVGPAVLLLVPAGLALGAGLLLARPLAPALEGLPEIELPDWLGLGELRLRAVEVIGARALPAEALVRLAALEPGARLIDVDPDAAAARVAAHPRVRSCRAMRLPPDRVVLRVRERVPLARLEGAHDGIDREGERVPLTAEEIERLPVVRGDAEAALAALGAAHDAGLELASVEARGRADVLLRPVGDGRAIRVGPDAASELASLARLEEVGLLARFPAGEVDMRFRDRAVLRAFEQEGVRDEQ